MQHARNLNQFYGIAGAIVNRYHPVITIKNATHELARQLLERAQSPNAVQQRVENENFRARNAQWRRINHRDVLDFILIDMDYLKDFTFGIYRINLAPAYIEDTVL